MAPWRQTLHDIIFEADTLAGKIFDVALIVCIVISIVAVSLESVASIEAAYGVLLRRIEWVFTGLFTLEYLLRLGCTRQPWRYAMSFFGLVDLLSILPTYLNLVLAGSHYFLVIRSLRVLRVFRILKLAQYVHDASLLTQALYASRRKITVFLIAVFTLVIVIGALMYVIEGEANGFTSIPLSVYWAIVTLTTVGYGDLSPQTNFGRAFASLVMILGYGIIAVPTGIVSVELSRAEAGAVSTQVCPECTAEGHDPDTVYCKYCSAAL